MFVLYDEHLKFCKGELKIQTMTTKEAREIYLDSDCSYFTMCTNHYAGYIQYRQLELPKEQEKIWRDEKIQMLCMEMRKTGDYRIFVRLCEITSKFHDYENLCVVLDALRRIKYPLASVERICVAKSLLGRKELKVRSGSIFWAFDIGQKAIAIILMDYVLELLHRPDEDDLIIEKKIRKERQLCKKIIAELNLNFSNRYLNHYYNF